MTANLTLGKLVVKLFEPHHCLKLICSHLKWQIISHSEFLLVKLLIKILRLPHPSLLPRLLYVLGPTLQYVYFCDFLSIEA